MKSRHQESNLATTPYEGVALDRHALPAGVVEALGFEPRVRKRDGVTARRPFQRGHRIHGAVERTRTSKAFLPSASQAGAFTKFRHDRKSFDGSSTRGPIRTDTERSLSALPLPLEIRGYG